MASDDECCDVCVFEIEEEEELDPRIEDYLEILNNTSQEINLLESELDRARNQFRNLLGKSTQKLNTSYEKLGKCVPKARPYYVLLADSKEAQTEAHKAAVQFQRANSVYQVAKETVALAEERVTNDGARKDFDAAWQEMLNHATKRFTESEEEKAHSEELHMAKAMTYGNIKQKLDTLEKDMPKTIAKAKPYFDLKDRLEYALKQERQNVEDLQRALSLAKQKYKATLQSLETISESIHEKRRAKASSQLPLRTPGVGAESIYSQSSDTSDLPSINLDIISETSSGIYLDEDSVSQGSRVSRTPSGCSLASRTPGVGTSCDVVSQSACSSTVCADKALVEHRLESASKKDISESEKVHRPRKSAFGELCFGLTNILSAKTTAQLEQMTSAIGDVDSSQHADHVSVKFDLSQDAQRETCTQSHEGCGSSPVHRCYVEDGRKSCESGVDGACGVGDIDCDAVTCSEVRSVKEEDDLEAFNYGSAKGFETVKGHDSDDTVREATPLQQLSQLSHDDFGDTVREATPLQQQSQLPRNDIGDMVREATPLKHQSQLPRDDICDTVREGTLLQQQSQLPCDDIGDTVREATPLQQQSQPPRDDIGDTMGEATPLSQLPRNDIGDAVREATQLQQLSQLPRHRRLRGAQFPILVGLSDCSRQPVPPVGPAPLAFYPPIPQPPQAVSLAQGGAQNHLADQSLDSDDQRSDQNTEVEVFV